MIIEDYCQVQLGNKMRVLILSCLQVELSAFTVWEAT